MIVVVQRRQLLSIPHVTSDDLGAGQMRVQLRGENVNTTLRQSDAGAFRNAVPGQSEGLLGMKTKNRIR